MIKKSRPLVTANFASSGIGRRRYQGCCFTLNPQIKKLQPSRGGVNRSMHTVTQIELAQDMLHMDFDGSLGNI